MTLSRKGAKSRTHARGCYQLPFSLECCPRGENLVGKVAGCVALWWAKGAIIGTEGYEVATIRAELCGCRNRAAAVATDSRQRSSALLAKLRLGGIVMIALRAFHPAGPEGEAGQILWRLNRACILGRLYIAKPFGL